MDKLKSFAAALLMFTVFALIVNGFCINHSLKTDHEVFGYWFDSYKDMSYDALAQNMEKDTVLLMGSSEFRHGRKSVYHPRNLFAGSGIDLMTIGGPWNQTLFHTIALGSLEKDLKSRKVILMVSPTWFKKTGVTPEGYAARFSETEYIAFMQNSHIPKEIKTYVAKRSEGLLKKYPDKAVSVGLINRAVLQEEKGSFSNLLLQAESYLAKGRDHAAVSMAMRALKKEPQIPAQAGNASGEWFTPSEQDWDKLLDRAIRSTGKRSNNPFFMMDRKWKKKYNKLYRRGHLNRRHKINANSLEFGDLEAFLQVCRESGIDAKLIILPVNGRWFDFIGTTEEQRYETTKKIQQMAGVYGVQTADLTQYEYDEFLTKDAVHPWSAGWVLIDEEIYRFCNKDKSKE